MHPVRRLARARSRAGIEACLAADVVALCDGGGLPDVPASPVLGATEVARLLLDVLKPGGGAVLTVESVNGKPGIVARSPAGTAHAVVAADCSPAQVTTLWLVLNPHKLTRWHRRS